jgi:hypothetical protein
MKKKYIILGLFGTSMSVTAGVLMGGILVVTAPISLPIVATIGAGTAALVAGGVVGGGMVMVNALEEELKEVKKEKEEQRAKECVDDEKKNAKNVPDLSVERDELKQTVVSLNTRLTALEKKFEVHQEITENDIRDLKGPSQSTYKSKRPKGVHKASTSTAANDETLPSSSDQKQLEQQKEKTSETHQADLLINQGIFSKPSDTLNEPKATKVRGIRKV